MLAGQDFGRGHQHRLAAGCGDVGHGQHGHHGLARADVALHQPRHALARRQVAADLGQGAALGAGEPVGQGGLGAGGERAVRDRWRGLGAHGGLAQDHGQLVGEQLVIGQAAALRALQAEVGLARGRVQPLQRSAPAGPALARHQRRVEPFLQLGRLGQRAERQAAQGARGQAGGGGIDRLVARDVVGALQRQHVFGVGHLHLDPIALGLAADRAQRARGMALGQVRAAALEPAQEAKAALVGDADAIGRAGAVRGQMGVDAHVKGLGLALDRLGQRAHRTLDQAGRGQEQQVAHPLAGRLDHQGRELAAHALECGHVGEQGEEDGGAHGRPSITGAGRVAQGRVRLPSVLLLPCKAGEGDHAQHGGGGGLDRTVARPSVGCAATSPAAQGRRVRPRP